VSRYMRGRYTALIGNPKESYHFTNWEAASHKLRKILRDGETIHSLTFRPDMKKEQCSSCGKALTTNKDSK